MKYGFAFFLSAIIFSSLVAQAESSSPSGYWNNRKAVNDLQKGMPGEAQNKFLSGLAKDPYQANLHLNLGLTYEALGQTEKAQSSYEVALKLAKNSQTAFAAAFNIAEVFQKAKKKDEALQYYQMALQFDPDSKETKTNVELLTQDQQGKGKGKDDKDQKDKKDGKDGDQKKDDPGKDDDKKDGKGDSNDDKKKDEKPKQYQKNKPQPQKFKSDDLTPGDVNKILGEIKQQERKIRGEFNKKEVKEKPRAKDW